MMEYNMKKLKFATLLVVTAITLGGCAASSTSPVGVNCIPGTPFQDLPLGCLGH
jgi:hypothetical protein